VRKTVKNTALAIKLFTMLHSEDTEISTPICSLTKKIKEALQVFYNQCS